MTIANPSPAQVEANSATDDDLSLLEGFMVKRPSIEKCLALGTFAFPRDSAAVMAAGSAARQ
jgi:hypothetical protein